MLKKFSLLMLLCLVLFFFCGCAADRPASGSDDASGSGDTRKIIDLADREIVIPVYPSRIAAMTGPSYEMVFMLGGHDRIVMTKSGHTTNYPLALLTNPDLANYEGIGANPSSAVNIEEYLRRDIDLVIYYNNDNELKKFEAVNLPAVVLTLNINPLDTVEDVMTQTLDEYIDASTRAVRTLADILGSDAVAEAETWVKYCHDKITMLYERTHQLTDEQRPTVFWGNTWGENILASYPLNNRYYEIWLCGGKLVGPGAGTGNFPEVTREQLFEWDPDIILVDNHGNYPELVIEHMYKDDSIWSSLSAVKNKQLHRIPAGVFFLDKGTTTTLMMLWLATITQPELFGDIDVKEEIKYYYREFYEFELTDEQAQKVIDGWYERVGDEPDL
jgi:iron complex transport system substrate-binding protein